MKPCLKYFTEKHGLNVIIFNAVRFREEMHTIELSEAAGVVYKYFLVYWGEHVFPCVREKLPEICKFQE